MFLVIIVKSLYIFYISYLKNIYIFNHFRYTSNLVISIFDHFECTSNLVILKLFKIILLILFIRLFLF